MEITKQILEKFYTQEKQSCREIGLVIGKSPAQVCRMMKKFGIKGREFSTKGLNKWSKNKVLSEETKDKIRQKHLGKTLSPEHRAKVVKTLSHGKGEENPNYKGGKFITDWGYVKVRNYDKYILEHRLVMEKHLGRKLNPDEHIHHLNHNKQDNRIENLFIINPSEHSSLHHGTKEARETKSKQMKTARAKRFWSTKKQI